MAKKNNYIKSPLNYVGGKTKLLPQILPLFPSEIKGRFIDLFAGGANVAVNVNAKSIIANDFNDRVIGIFKYLQSHDINEILDYVHTKCAEYGLSKTNVEGFNTFRNMYNNGERSPIDLFILICHCFNHQIRFNSKGEFNMPFGKDRSEYNKSIEQNLINFKNAIGNVAFTSKDFREIKLDKVTSDDFVYADPPYLITCASYNESGGWTEKDEYDLLSLLDSLSAKGCRFALSNVYYNKGKENEILQKWVADHGYTVHHLDNSYSNCNYHAKDKVTKADEVLIINY